MQTHNGNTKTSTFGIKMSVALVRCLNEICQHLNFFSRCRRINFSKLHIILYIWSILDFITCIEMFASRISSLLRTWNVQLKKKKHIRISLSKVLCEKNPGKKRKPKSNCNYPSLIKNFYHLACRQYFHICRSWHSNLDFLWVNCAF